MNTQHDATDQLFAAARQYAERYYPGVPIADVGLRLGNGAKLRLPLPGHVATRAVVNHPQADTAPCPSADVVSHSPDFATVRWHDGRVYSFTPMQRAVIEVLWDAMEKGAPAVDQAALLEAAESRCRRLSDLFDRNPAFGLVIVPGYKYGAAMGTYQLAPPS